MVSVLAIVLWLKLELSNNWCASLLWLVSLNVQLSSKLFAIFSQSFLISLITIHNAFPSLSISILQHNFLQGHLPQLLLHVLILQLFLQSRVHTISSICYLIHLMFCVHSQCYFDSLSSDSSERSFGVSHEAFWAIRSNGWNQTRKESGYCFSLNN